MINAVGQSKGNKCVGRGHSNLLNLLDRGIGICRSLWFVGCKLYNMPHIFELRTLIQEEYQGVGEGLWHTKLLLHNKKLFYYFVFWTSESYLVLTPNLMLSWASGSHLTICA